MLKSHLDDDSSDVDGGDDDEADDDDDATPPAIITCRSSLSGSRLCTERLMSSNLAATDPPWLPD